MPGEIMIDMQDYERLVKAELNYVTFDKKQIGEDYTIHNSCDEERALIERYLKTDKVRKYVLTQNLILDAIYKDFAEKAKFNSETQKCEIVKNSLSYFLKNLNYHKGKLLSEAIKDQLNYTYRSFIEENRLESNIKSSDQMGRIEKLKSIGNDIFLLIETIYPAYSVDCKDGVKEL